MFGKKYLHNRGLMIAIAVIALMTLTAGTAVAASMKAKFSAAGAVSSVSPGGTVESEFKIKNGEIKSIKIHTTGEGVGGELTSVFDCTGECTAAGDALLGSISSTHESRVRLKVTYQPAPHPLAVVTGFEYLATFEVVGGDLRGKLKAVLTVIGSEGTLVGKAKLKIAGTSTSYYACLTAAPSATPPFGFGPIAVCASELGAAAGAILVPIDLHVEDTGNFKVKNEFAKVTGKISVVVDNVFPLGPVTGPISVTKGKATFSAD